ncbi:Saccharopine dehydrogenase-domain-containing protein [Cyathus striatus]|nr:Saccharopine dehydrogenase-domain-containing protein [Cyathus striatus]
MHSRSQQWRCIRRMSTSRAYKPNKLTIGIRQEDPERIWERRAPITPDDVHHLITTKNVDVQIQPCDRRVFPVHDYVQAGAELSESLSASHIVLGIKEIPIQQLSTLKSPVLRPGLVKLKLPRTHFMFSHTAKGQPYNMPLLSQFINPSLEGLTFPTLVDYEYLTNEKGARTVGFGWFAGVAGVLESLSSMAHAHLELGIASPFLYTPRPHTLPTLERLRATLREIGTWIANDGTPTRLGPFVIGVTGSGQVARGCISMLSELPIQYVNVADLHALVKDPETDLHKIYLVHAKPEDYLVNVDGKPYDRTHYYESPQSYRSKFHETVAPYLTLFLNGTGWSPGFPRLMTTQQLSTALQKAQKLGGARFTNIGDISCDPAGGLEFMTQVATLSEPFYKYRPKGLPANLPSVQMMTVDILPTAIPLDASKHFSNAMLPYLESLIHTYKMSSPGPLAQALNRATIASKGKLTSKHDWLLPQVIDVQRGKHIKGSRQSATAPAVQSKDAATNEEKTSPFLGSGMVAGPAVELIAKRRDVSLVIASNSIVELQRVAGDYLDVKYQVIDIANQDEVAQLIRETDVVISLLPTNFHVPIAEQCITHQKHLVTASYISPEMHELNSSAQAADVLLLNEIGLDPGIDHCSAVDLLDRIKSEGKTVKSFISFCGGLPAPEVEEVPLRYKFSWRPAGVLMAALNGAIYKLNHAERNIAPDELLKSHFQTVPVTSQFDLEGIPNRNSMVYQEAYALPSSIRTLLRGTLRYPGFSETMQGFKDLGLLGISEKFTLKNWSSLISQACDVAAEGQANTYNIERAKSLELSEPALDALEWLGLKSMPYYLSDGIRMPPLPKDPLTPLEHFAYLLANKLRYEPGEKDMVVLHHEIIAQGRKEGDKEEVYQSSLVTYGTPHASAMARTVGIPVAIAALAVVDGRVEMRGVIGPTHPSICSPVLDGLAEVGLGMKEKHIIMQQGTDTIEDVLIKKRGEAKRE